MKTSGLIWIEKLIYGVSQHGFRGTIQWDKSSKLGEFATGIQGNHFSRNAGKVPSSLLTSFDGKGGWENRTENLEGRGESHICFKSVHLTRLII